MNRKEKKQKEQEILAQMDAAMLEQRPQGEEQEERKGDETMPSQMHCKRCKTLMKNGVCPTCGFTVYMPMDEGKRKKIRWIVTAVALGIFILLFVALQAGK